MPIFLVIPVSAANDNSRKAPPIVIKWDERFRCSGVVVEGTKTYGFGLTACGYLRITHGGDWRGAHEVRGDHKRPLRDWLRAAGECRRSA
jgi:hypothetical protein